MNLDYQIQGINDLLNDLDKISKQNLKKAISRTLLFLQGKLI